MEEWYTEVGPEPNRPSDRPTDTSFHVARDTQIALYAITDSDYFILKSENNFQYILFTQLERIMAVSR